MNYSDLLDAITSTLVSTGLIEVADPRDGSLMVASRGGFDGSFLITNKSGAQPWPELSTGPVHWRSVLRLEVATNLTTSALVDSKLIESRARGVFNSLVYSTAPVGQQLYKWQDPTVERVQQSKRIVWSILFMARWTE